MQPPPPPPPNSGVAPPPQTSAAVVLSVESPAAHHHLHISGGGGEKERVVPPCYEVMKYYVAPSLLALVILIYQARPNSLFATNPAPTWTFLLSTFFYWLIVLKIKTNNLDHHSHTKWSRILNQAALVSVLLSTSSPLSILLPPRLSIVCREFWILVTLGMVWLLVYSAYVCLGAMVASAVVRFWARYGIWNPPV